MSGYLGLFFSAFVAATLLPLSSEAVLAALSAADAGDAVTLLAVATAGNVLGAVVNWALGAYCLHWRDRRWFPFKPDQLAKAQSWFGRYGLWSLLLAWLPVIGDPLTFVAGIMRVRLPVFLVLVALGKAGRYGVVLAVAQGVFA